MPRSISQLVHPFLAIFIQRHIAANPRWTPDSLAWKWDELYGAMSAGEGQCTGRDTRSERKRSVIDQWLRVYHRLSPSDAERLLDMLELRQAWSDFISSPQFLAETSGVFNFYSRSLGFIEELDLNSIRSRNMDVRDVVAQVVRIDVDHFAAFGSTVTDDKVANWERIFVAHPDTWRVFVSERDEVLAYWNFVSLPADQFGRACRGDLPEVEITHKVCQDVRAGHGKLYGPTVCVKRSIGGFDKKHLGAKAIGSFLYSVARLENEGASFSEICTVVASEEGRRWVERRFGLGLMPRAIGQHLAQRAGWAFVEDGDIFTPALYYGRVDDNIRRVAGLLASWG